MFKAYDMAGCTDKVSDFLKQLKEANVEPGYSMCVEETGILVNQDFLQIPCAA